MRVAGVEWRVKAGSGRPFEKRIAAEEGGFYFDLKGRVVLTVVLIIVALQKVSLARRSRSRKLSQIEVNEAQLLRGPASLNLLM